MPNQTRKDMVSLVNCHHNAKITNMHDSVATKADLKPSGSRSTRSILGYKGKKHTRTGNDSGFVEEGKKESDTNGETLNFLFDCNITLMSMGHQHLRLTGSSLSGNEEVPDFSNKETMERQQQMVIAQPQPRKDLGQGHIQVS